MLHGLIEILLALLAVFGLFSLGWIVFGRILAPSQWYVPAFAVIPTRGDGETLEQTVRELLWLRAGNLKRYTVVIADAGLTVAGRSVAETLTGREPGVTLCALEKLPEILR